MELIRSIELTAELSRLRLLYKVAAGLTRCKIVRVDDTLNNTKATFTGKVSWVNDFLVTQGSLELDVSMGQGIWWTWRKTTLVEEPVANSVVTIIISGNPEITTELGHVKK